MTFGDNDKAVFGAGSDLQIYHSTNSYIQDSGAGSLFLLTQGAEISLLGNTSANIWEGLYKTVLLSFITTETKNQPQLLQASTLRVGTTTDNATVGSGTASTYVDLTVNGASTANYGPMIELQSAGTAFGKISNYGRIQGGTSTDMFVTTATTNNLLLGTNNTERLRIDASGNIGIGTTSPSSKLVVADSNGAGLEIIPQTSNDRTTLLSYDRNASTYQSLDQTAQTYNLTLLAQNVCVSNLMATLVSAQLPPKQNYILTVMVPTLQ